MIAASGIAVQFGAKPLFSDVAVKFGGGNRYGLIGANGCGKSTFMRILGGELEPSAGTGARAPARRWLPLGAQANSRKRNDELVAICDQFCDPLREVIRSGAWCVHDGMGKYKPAERIEHLEPLIFTVRRQRVMLDADLAHLYGVATKALNQAVKRNTERFPDDFAFQLTTVEAAGLRSQIAAPGSQPAERNRDVENRSQIVTGSQKHRDPAIRPWAFTEHGALMAANILRSEQAVRMSVYVIRAFVRLREVVAANAAILKRLAEIDRTLLQHDAALRDIYRKLLPLLQPPPDPPKRRIGFQTIGE